GARHQGLTARRGRRGDRCRRDARRRRSSRGSARELRAPRPPPRQPRAGITRLTAVRIGVSLRTAFLVDDARVGAGWIVERAGAAREAGLDCLLVGDHHATPVPYYQNTPLLGRLLAEWGDGPFGALFLLPCGTPYSSPSKWGRWRRWPRDGSSSGSRPAGRTSPGRWASASTTGAATSRLGSTSCAACSRGRR